MLNVGRGGTQMNNYELWVGHVPLKFNGGDAHALSHRFSLRQFKLGKVCLAPLKKMKNELKMLQNNVDTNIVF